MTLFLSPSRSLVFSYPFPVLRSSFKPISSIRTKPISATIPARDRIIDFGKYKGKMLGTLPSKYLKWVSKTLRARDFEEWAKLTDEVLQDPVYRDRIEWEFAENILNGNTSSRVSRTETPVSDLLEISERFGWDDENKVGWSKIDFALLGTSKSGRIPRISVSRSEKQNKFRVSVSAGTRVFKNEEVGESRISKSENMGLKEQKHVGHLKKGFRVSVTAEEDENGVRMRREERRGRQRLKKDLKVTKLRVENRGKKVDRERDNSDEEQDQDKMEYGNPFPGREALLSNRRRVL